METTSEDPAESLPARVARLEAREQALREFLLPAYWRLTDELDDLRPATGVETCLGCGRTGPTSSFAAREDACVFGGGRLRRFECAACGCVFGPRKVLDLPEALLSADYRLLYAHYSEGDSTEAELRAFELLKPRRDGLYLNWGSGAWSRSVEILRARGYDVWGFEPNAGDNRPHVVRHRGEVSARFTGIFSNNVIEHLIDPAEQFADFHRILAPGGRMAHASPCYRWSYAFTRFHVFFPLDRAPQALAARTGFAAGPLLEDQEFRAVVYERLGA